jgi:hypothetical protein
LHKLDSTEGMEGFAKTCIAQVNADAEVLQGVR